MSLFSLVSILVSLAALSSYINYRYIKLPTIIGVMLMALIASLALLLAGSYASNVRDEAAALVERINFNQVVLHGMLAFLLFAGSIQVKFEDLRREWLPIVSLAIVGTLASTCIVGGVMWLVLGWLGFHIPLLHALLFGALISPTDPIAVLGIMRSVGASKQLEIQAAGESLFNDGLGVVVFMVLLQLTGLESVGGSGTNEPFSIEISTVAMLFLKEIGGGLALALAAGTLVYHMLKRVDNYQVEVLLTLALCMGIYALAETLHFSAPIAVVIAGLLVGNHGRAFAMTEKTRVRVDSFWELIDELLNIILFLLIGLELLVLPIESTWMVAGVLAIPVVLLARGLSVAGIIGSVKWAKAQSTGAIAILTWGGLRGAISVAMALSLPMMETRSLLLTMTYFVVIFSILIQGLTVGRLIRSTGRMDVISS